MRKNKQDNKTPFFARFLETQELSQAQAGATLKYPSDRDEEVTLKFPSDDDEGLPRA
jgi:hypothetical protein